MNQKAPMPPRVTIDTEFVGKNSFRPVLRGWKEPFSRFLEPLEYLSLQEHTALCEEQVRAAEKDIAKMANIQLASGSLDEYGCGLYNGMMLALCFLAKDPASVDRTVKMDEYKALCKASRAKPEQGESGGKRE